jgi:hypothetical protein
MHLPIKSCNNKNASQEHVGWVRISGYVSYRHSKLNRYSNVKLTTLEIRKSWETIVSSFRLTKWKVRLKMASRIHVLISSYPISKQPSTDKRHTSCLEESKKIKFRPHIRNTVTIFPVLGRVPTLYHQTNTYRLLGHKMKEMASPVAPTN